MLKLLIKQKTHTFLLWYFSLLRFEEEYVLFVKIFKTLCMTNKNVLSALKRPVVLNAKISLK